MNSVEAIALLNWLLVIALALPAASVLLPSLGMSALLALCGLGTMIVFVSGASAAFAWVAVGLACLASVAAAVGGHSLVDDSSGVLSGIRPAHKEAMAGLVGLELPFLATAALLSAVAAAS